MQKITPFLMFEGKAEEAMHFYMSLFPDSKIKSMSRYDEDEEGAAGTVRHAEFCLNGQSFMCIDSIVSHPFTFTPAMSLHVSCRTEHEIDELYARLSEDGHVLMPLDTYPFSKKYVWLTDKFNVSWQLALAEG